MPVTVDVKTELDEEAAKQVAAQIRALAKQAVLDGVQDTISQLFTNA